MLSRWFVRSFLDTSFRFFVCYSSTSHPGGSLVDGLPPASSKEEKEEEEKRKKEKEREKKKENQKNNI